MLGHVLEALQLLAFASGASRAVRLRHAVAIAGAALVGYLIAADLLGAFAVRQPGNPFSPFVSMMLGPCAWPLRTSAALPLPALLIQQPLALRTARALVCSLITVLCLKQSNAQNPLLPRAAALDAIALPFAGVAVVDALETIILLWAWLMIGEDGVLVPSH
jgi:hypothetical protein